jgi:hypothetical protein
MWLVIRNIIQMVDLGKKNWRVVNFASCVIVESVDHLLFQCPIAVFIWTVVRDALSSIPRV